ncbi:MAG: dihydrolipoyl dehydrogenase [Deltaproteobacteria bacterium]|nr:dihydrolipoyl dehydrogenase [Deltaproteobacteria bacterium]
MTAENTYDLVVIGSGPAGYTAAAKASGLGMTVACVEKAPRPGGVCLNVGCIPSKALLDSSEIYAMAKSGLSAHGIRVTDPTLDLSTMMTRKDQVVEALTGQVRKLLEGGRVALLQGTARVMDAHRVEVAGSDGGISILEAKFILLATGSVPVTVPGLEFDEDRIVTSTGALKFTEVPKTLGIIGGGYIGLELGSVWQRLGAKVTVIEMLPQIAASLDGQISRALKRTLDKQGMAFRLKTTVTRAAVSKDGVKISLESGGKSESVDFDRVLVAVGRKPLTTGLGLETVGVEKDPKTGHVRVNARYQTSVSSIYAVGDIVPGPMLAHKASAEGIAAVEAMAGLFSEVNYDTLPSVIYTWPEVAGVGLTEEQLKARGIPYVAGAYPFSGNARARCMGETEGLVKILSHARTDRVLGVHMIGPRVSEMIAEAVMSMEMGASSEDIARTVHSHPTFSEALMEAAGAVQRQLKK